MGVPFEALLPYGIMLGFFGLTGAGISKIRHMKNGGKRARHSVDIWDRVSPARSHSRNSANIFTAKDRRLTGSLRGQTDNPNAPLGFELNNPWKVEKRFI
ncbi:hypothetical protein PVAG01_05540 [Phlyctema vagabunda]|uniref:NADH dehydrogenase [ubiquinone] 1 alpha subcomplex subunit 1 n=1 Tax=Phlyctema vagabunda TaxID=108571 RepID=A0ABR4PKE5_9HELO